MTTDFRVLCAELLDWAEVTAAHYIQLPAVMLRVRAALADEPAVPEGREPASVTEQPSDEELRDIWDSGHLPSDEELANDNGEQDLQFLFTSAYYQWLEENPDAMTEHKTKCIRAVFNAGRRWGTPNFAETRSSLGDAPQPVPVSERLPRPEDCDGEGKCWWFHDEDNASCSHWLPAHALPLPTANE